MKEFFKFVFASMIGVLLSLFVMFVLGILLIIGIVSTASNESKATIEDNTVLDIKECKVLKCDVPIEINTEKQIFLNTEYPLF